MAETDPIKTNGKALEKLAVVISKGLGITYRAEQKETGTETHIIDNGSSDRIRDRLLHKETSRQKNIDCVCKVAAGQLCMEEAVSPEPENIDWTTRFFNIVEDVSDKGMQDLWGRILAYEVILPGSFSLRTIEILKNLSIKEAEAFIKFACLALHSGNTSFIINPDNSEFLANEFNISFNDRLILEEAGLINSNDLFYTLRGNNVRTPFEFGRVVLLVERENGCPEQSIPILAFTKTGSELKKLIKQPINLKYFNRFAELFTGEKSHVSYAVILSKKGANIVHTNPPVKLPAV